MLRRLPFYPILFGIYPVLMLGAYNIGQIAPGAILRPLAFSTLLAGILFCLARLVLRDWHRAALATSILLLLFFSYGHVYAQIKGTNLGGVFLFRHRTLAPFWILLALAGIYWVGWKLKSPGAATLWLNVIALALLVYPTVSIVGSALWNALPTAAQRTDHASTGNANTPFGKPDIYYIILDEYARQDVLADRYGYDNHAFVQALKDRGFYVAECSQSNYAQTELSLSSSLNMDYLDSLGTKYGKLIKHSAVRTFLESQGYKTLAFATGFAWTELDDADYYIRPVYSGGQLTEFENLLLGTTMLRIYRDQVSSATSAPQRYRDRTLSVLANLKHPPAHSSPLFVFAHIVSPHYPYVFDGQGNPIYYDLETSSAADQIKGYDGQVAFISGRILDVVDAILAKPGLPPIILIQGDHGPSDANHPDRMRNLSAYYLPKAEDRLYPNISPVNSFRIILDAYFGQELPLLEDRSYFSTYQDRTNFEFIPNSCPGG